MTKTKSLSLLGWILVLLQLLNPFLHAHAQGLDGTSGFHVHGVQASSLSSSQASNHLLMAADDEHWVLGMPAGHRAVEYSGEVSDSNELALPLSWLITAVASHHAGFKPLKASPPIWRLLVSSPPPALAPPAI